MVRSPIERYGVNVMSLGFLMDVDTPVIWRGPMVYKAVEQFLGDVAWGKQDFLVVDPPPGTGDAQLTLTQKVALSGAVIVTTPQDVALIDARKGLAMFQKVNVPFLGHIPIDPRVALAGDSGMPIVAAEPDSVVTKAFVSVAEAVARAVGA